MKKITNTFFVSVEGYTEFEYLERLQELINKGDYTYKVKFIKKISKPTSFAKSISTGFSEYPFYHICDYEGNEEENQQKFTHLLDDIKEAKKITKVNYNLAYTNLCFELWLILHKNNFRHRVVKKEEYKDKINQLYNEHFSSWSSIKKENNIKKLLDKISIQDIKFAIKNAEEIEKDNKTNQDEKKYKGLKYYTENPSLNLHMFVKYVFKVCGVD